jgi:hypothetical protein
MTRKKNITKDNLISWYMEFVLENNHSPKSIYSFAKENNFEETDFYKFYGTFEAIEESIFSEFFHHTVAILSKSEDYENYDPRNKLLSFYFTFFENLSANRSFVLLLLGNDKEQLKKLKVLSTLKNSFTDYISSLAIETIDFKQKNITQIQQKGIKESAWIQFLITLKFWLNDTSASFEKTDIFIEKSVNTSFDLIDTAPLKSIIDFGKFLYKEKMNIQ